MKKNRIKLKELIKTMFKRRYTNWEVIDVYEFNGITWVLEVCYHLENNKIKRRYTSLGYRYNIGDLKEKLIKYEEE